MTDEMYASIRAQAAGQAAANIQRKHEELKLPVRWTAAGYFTYELGAWRPSTRREIEIYNLPTTAGEIEDGMRRQWGG